MRWPFDSGFKWSIDVLILRMELSLHFSLYTLDRSDITTDQSYCFVNSY